jgi:pumilio homology domain family member 6
LAETDATKAQTSKKDDSVRAAEILKAASESLLDFVARHGKEAALDTGGSLLVLEIMLQADGGTCFRSFPSSSVWAFLKLDDNRSSHLSHSLVPFLDQSAATQTLLELIAAPYPALAISPPHPIDSSHVARLYKTLLQGGHFNQSSRSITKPPSSFSPPMFASSFLAVVGQDVTVSMAQGSGAFVIAELCNRVNAEGTKEERRLLQTWFTEGGISESIQEKEMKGKGVLLESINALLST